MAKYIFIEDEFKPHDKEVGETEEIRLVDFLKSLPLVNPKVELNHKDVFKIVDDELIITIEDDYILKEDDILVIVNEKGAAGLIWGIVKFVIGVVISYALNRLLYDKPSVPKPKTSTSEKGESEYSISTSQNQAKKGQPIPECFGTYVRFPDIIAPTYYRYEDNKEFLYMLLCLGKGQHTIEQIYIEDTDVDDFTEGTFYSRLYKTESEHSGDNKISTDWSNNIPIGTYTPQTINETAPYEIVPYLNSGDYLSIDLEPNGQETNMSKFRIACTMPSIGAYEDQFFYVYVSLFKDNVFIEERSTSKYYKNLNPSETVYFNYEILYPKGDFDEARLQFRSVGRKNRGSENVVTATFRSLTYQELNLSPDNYFRDIVITSAEVENFKLRDKPEDKMNLFRLNPTGTRADIVEVDIILYGGLYTQNSTGGLSNRTIQFKTTLLDLDGNETVYTESITDNTRSQIQKTYSYSVTPSSYMVKVERITSETTDTKVQDEIYARGIKAYLLNEDNPTYGTKYINYGNVSLLAVKIKATEGISSKGQFKVKVRASRDDIVTAKDTLEYIWTSQNGGRQPIEKIDLPLTMENDNFNGFIDKRTTVLQALQSVASNNRYNIFSSFDVLTARKDEEQPIRTMMFNEANIIKDSLVVTMSSNDESDYDGIRVKYNDFETFEDVFYTYPEDSSFPQDIELDGITDEVLAEEQAVFIYNEKTKRNVRYEFDTELDGLVPTLYDRCAITHPILSTSQSGVIVAFTNDTVTLNELVNVELEEPKIFFRGRDGKPSDLYTVLSIDARTITVDVSEKALPDDLYIGDEEQRTIYSIGETGFVDDIIITEIKPKRENIISIKAWNYDDSIYP